MVNLLAPVVTTYVKVANVPGLYRHARSGRYYACKKLNGIRRERSLQTSDRKIAERRLKEWTGNLEKVDAEVEKTTLGQLIERFVMITGGMAENTHVTNNAIINRFLGWWPHGKDFQVRLIRPSSLDEWLAHEEPRLRNVTYNRYAGFLKQLFEIAVKDRIIPESPARQLRQGWKKPQAVRRLVPTVAQFEAIVADIRGQTASPHACVTGDFVDFLGMAGLDAPLDVVVGGLGLGYTARAALKHPAVRSLIVVEALDAVIKWHERGLVPLGPELTGDSRCRFVHGDFFALASGRGFDPAESGRKFHAVLLDIDHSPQNLLHSRHGAFYQPAGHPEVTCTKGQFQGFNVWVTMLRATLKALGMSLSRHFEMTEPLPAPDTAEIWSFVVQYVYQNALYGQMSQPVSITVRGLNVQSISARFPAPPVPAAGGAVLFSGSATTFSVATG